MEVFVLGLVGIALWFFIVKLPRGRVLRAKARAYAEARALSFLTEFPTADDAQIAQLMRDELISADVDVPVAYEWATAITVGRVRRAAVIRAIRSGNDGV